MKVLSIKDIIGPIMIGPSSSHTAGALRIALMCRRLLAAAPRRVTFTLYGSFAHTYHGHGTDKALVAGMLGMEADDTRIRDSFDLARAANLEFSFVPDAQTPTEHPNTVDILVEDAEGAQTNMRGESIGGGAAVITRLNGVDVRLTGEYNSIVVQQRDVTGVLAHIATCLSVFDVNIATTRLFRERKGQIAYTIMETDDVLDYAVARAISNNPNILDVRIVASSRAGENGTTEDAPGGVPGDTAGAADEPEFSPEEAAALFEAWDFATGAQALDVCAAENITLGQAILTRERYLSAVNGLAPDTAKRYLARVLEVMRASGAEPITHPRPSMGRLLGGEAAKAFRVRRIRAVRPLACSCYNLRYGGA